MNNTFWCWCESCFIQSSTVIFESEGYTKLSSEQRGFPFRIFHFPVNIPKQEVYVRLAPAPRITTRRISSGDDVTRVSHIEAVVLSARRLAMVSASFVPRPFSSARSKDQHNVDARVAMLPQLSKG